MATVDLDDALLREVVAVSDENNAQEAVVKVLADYLREHKADVLTESYIKDDVKWGLNGEE